jgi:hypothetical protein
MRSALGSTSNHRRIAIRVTRGWSASGTGRSAELGTQDPSLLVFPPIIERVSLQPQRHFGFNSIAEPDRRAETRLTES